MKKILLFLGNVLTAAVFISGVLYIWGPSEWFHFQTDNFTTDKVAALGEVMSGEGDVRLKRSGVENWQKADHQHPLYAQDKIYVGDAAKTHINIFDFGEIKIDYKTLISIDEIPDIQTESSESLIEIKLLGKSQASKKININKQSLEFLSEQQPSSILIDTKIENELRIRQSGDGPPTRIRVGDKMLTTAKDVPIVIPKFTAPKPIQINISPPEDINKIPPDPPVSFTSRGTTLYLREGETLSRTYTYQPASNKIFLLKYRNSGKKLEGREGKLAIQFAQIGRYEVTLGGEEKILLEIQVTRDVPTLRVSPLKSSQNGTYHLVAEAATVRPLSGGDQYQFEFFSRKKTQWLSYLNATSTYQFQFKLSDQVTHARVKVVGKHHSFYSQVQSIELPAAPKAPKLKASPKNFIQRDTKL